VAEQVVDRLEAVEVDEHCRDGEVLLQELLEPLDEHGTVRQAGERVVAGEVLQRLTGAMEVAHVVPGDHEPADHGVVEQVDDFEPDRLAGRGGVGGPE